MNAQEENIQELARKTLHAMDALLEQVHGGEGLRALIEARQILASFVQQGKLSPSKTLAVQLPPVGGVTMVRGGQTFSITDDELEAVREAINTRKREIRKRERREAKSSR